MTVGGVGGTTTSGEHRIPWTKTIPESADTEAYLGLTVVSDETPQELTCSIERRDGGQVELLKTATTEVAAFAMASCDVF
ncbi:hypothetical protein [Plantactinospora endophytica]|uniref:hypothetical protein n=1 Tax=Plantactinospora endophytica TaxID=673535 RepID=UPI001941B0B0|nr:hypothetical protein [Plantactinospora endophytica]